MRATLVVLALVTLALVPAPAVVAPGPSTLAYAVYPAPSSMGPGAGEPSIGVNWHSGKVFFQNSATTLRVDFDDATMPPSAAWSDVTPPDSVLNIDPILFTDSAWGRTFAGGLDGACSVLSYTDDDGASWVPMTNSCAAPGYDHETIGSGPAALGGPTLAHVVYYCAQNNVIMCATSLDGGLTFDPAVPVTCSFVDPGLHGSVHVAKNGAAYLPVKNCGGHVGVAISRSNGLTWSTTTLTGPAAVTPENGFDPDVATTPSNWAYIAFQGVDNHPYAALSKDNGVTFSTPVDVGASAGIRQATFVEAVAGDNERAAVVFLGSTTAGSGFLPNFTGVWDLYVATTVDAGGNWTVTKVTTDPVQRGWICDGGFSPGCGGLGGTAARNLLDFIDATVDANGRVVVAFADGCIDACATPNGTAAQSTSDYATIARQACGPSLFASVGNVEGTTTCVVGTPPPPTPTPLAGTLYMTGLTPTANTDWALTGIVVRDTLTATPPTGAAPRVASNAASLGGQTARSPYDASWSLGATTPRSLNGTVTIHAWIATAGANTGVLQPVRLTASLFDLGPTGSASLSSAFATNVISITPSPVPTEVVFVFPAQTRVLTEGLTVTISQSGAGETDTLYDAASTPTRVVFS